MPYTEDLVLKLERGFENSFLLGLPSRLDNWIYSGYKGSFLHVFFHRSFNWYKSSFIYAWLTKPEQETEVFETSKFTNSCLRTGHHIIEKTEYAGKQSFIYRLFKKISPLFK